MTILQHFKKPVPRAQQAEILRTIESEWNDFDVFVVQAPTGLGKSDVSEAIATWAVAERRLKSSIIVPTNILLDQYLADFPELATIRRKDTYDTTDMYKRDLKIAQTAPIRLANQHSLLAHRLYSPVMIYDEAHTLINFLQEDSSAKLWRHDYDFPSGLRTVSDVLEWIEKRPATPKLQLAREQLTSVQEPAIIEYTTDLFKGRPKQVLKVRPLNVNSGGTKRLWNHAVEKFVLLSATIGAQDIRELGLDRKRVRYIEVDSPIPAANRPVIFAPAGNIVYGNPNAIRELADGIELVLSRHPSERGLIHLPYRMVASIQPLLKNPRLLWHDKSNKGAALTDFKTKVPGDNRVFVASGLYEGVNLPYGDARFQIIGKVPYLSLADVAIRSKADTDPAWYAWAAMRTIIQGSGRICRADDDYGVTYILDKQFDRLRHNPHIKFPQFFESAIRDLATVTL